MKKQGVYFNQRFIDAVLYQLGEDLARDMR